MDKLRAAVATAEELKDAVVCIDMPLALEVHAVRTALEANNAGKTFMARLRESNSFLLVSSVHEKYWIDMHGTVVHDDCNRT